MTNIPRALTAEEMKWLQRDVDAMAVSHKMAERIYSNAANRLTYVEQQLTEAKRVIQVAIEIIEEEGAYSAGELRAFLSAVDHE